MTENTNGRALALSPAAAPLAKGLQIDADRMALLCRTLGADLKADELQLFLAVAARLGLDPFVRQIHAVKDKRNGRFFVHVGIDGRRLIAHRTGMVDGTLGPYWTGPDGQWRDVWLENEPPAAARFGVLKKGCREPFWGVARYKSFVGTGPNWEQRADHQLAKVAEDHAWRKAFPYEMGGIPTAYSPEHDQEANAGGDEAAVAASELGEGHAEGEYREIDRDTGEITETTRAPAGADSSEPDPNTAEDVEAAFDAEPPARGQQPGQPAVRVYPTAHSLWVACKNAGLCTDAHEPSPEWDEEMLTTFVANWRPELHKARKAKGQE